LSVSEASRTLTFRFAIDAAETVRAGREVQRTKGRRWLTWAIWPMLALLTAMYLVGGEPLRDLWRIGLVALFLGALQLGVPLIQRWQLRRMYASSPVLREPQVYTFSDAGVTITGGPANLSLGWDAFVRAMETREFFLLFSNPRSAYYLPKRAIGTPADVGELRALLDAHLGSRAETMR
jgi:hypothetical protein